MVSRRILSAVRIPIPPYSHIVGGTTSQVRVISYSLSSRYPKADYHKDGVRVFTYSPSGLQYAYCNLRRLSVRGSTSLVGVNPQVPSVSLVCRKYEVGGQLQLLNAVYYDKTCHSLCFLYS